MRSYLNSSKSEYISVADEIQLIQGYLFIEQNRLNNKFEYSVFKDEVVPNNFLIPTMIIQPFVENAIWHGLQNSTEKGEIIINFQSLPNNLLITIQDNGIGRKQAKKLMSKNKKNISNEVKSTQIIEDRLTLFSKINKKTITFEIEDLYPEKVNAGTVVKIIVWTPPNPPDGGIIGSEISSPTF